MQNPQLHNHPINLFLRFLLELGLLTIFALWGWHKFNGGLRYLLTPGLPLLAATIWGVFRVEGDPGKAPVPIPGWLRLVYEMVLFASAAVFLFQLQRPQWAFIFIVVSAVHYLVSYPRIIGLLKKGK